MIQPITRQKETRYFTYRKEMVLGGLMSEFQERYFSKPDTLIMCAKRAYERWEDGSEHDVIAFYYIDPEDGVEIRFLKISICMDRSQFSGHHHVTFFCGEKLTDSARVRINSLPYVPFPEFGTETTAEQIYSKKEE